MENRIAIFSKLIRDFMRDVPLAVPMGTSLADIARRMGADQARAEGDGLVQEAGRAGGLTGTEMRVD